MTIWILALVLLASGVGLGLRQGVIRVAFAFVGIVVAALFAGLLGKLFKPLLPHLGIHNPVLIWIIAPIVAFVIVWFVFKTIGFAVHRKVNVYYKYKADDLRLALWERFNSRVGGCVGVLNGAVWLILISFVIFNLSYWTAQIAPSENETKTVRLVNKMGEDLQSTGLDKAARSVATMPGMYYKMANLIGLIVQNPELSERLGNYPAFISLGERDDIRALAQDSNLTGAWKQSAPLAALKDSQVKDILKNQDLVHTVWSILETNMDDLTNYLATGKSPKYDSEKIVGRWDFDLVPALAELRQAQPHITPTEMKAIRALWSQAFAQTTFVAGTDGQAFLKNIPDFKTQPPNSQTWKGQWSGGPTNYVLSLSTSGPTESATAETDGLRLTIKMEDTTFVFERAY
jgi:Colicin V production protein